MREEKDRKKGPLREFLSNRFVRNRKFAKRNKREMLQKFFRKGKRNQFSLRRGFPLFCLFGGDLEEKKSSFLLKNG